MLINIKHTKKKGIITLSKIQFRKQHPHFPRQAQSLHFAIYSLKKKSNILLKLITVDYLGKTIYKQFFTKMLVIRNIQKIAS